MARTFATAAQRQRDHTAELSRRGPREVRRTAAKPKRDEFRPRRVSVGSATAVAICVALAGVAFIVRGAILGDGPEIFGRTAFPGTVSMNLPEAREQLAVYIELGGLGSNTLAPEFIGPVATVDGAEVRINNRPDISRVGGLASDLVPIGVFVAPKGDYEVTVDASADVGSVEGTFIVVGDPNHTAGGKRSAVIGLGLVLLGGLGIGGWAYYLGRQRSNARRELPVLLAAPGTHDGPRSGS